MKQGHWRTITGATLIVFTLVAAAAAQETGRTDGPDESEYGKGGYPYGGGVEQFYITPSFGSGSVDGATGLLYGFDVGYKTDGWIGVQGGYSYLSEAQLHIATLGARFDYAFEPFVSYVTMQAGLYSKDGGNRNFGVAPGAGIDIQLGDRLRLGLKVAHDFILSDPDPVLSTDDDVDRISLGISVAF
jgi:hypothetical protein